MKSRTVFSCQSCGAQAPRWMGRCPECNQWNTLVEESFREVAPSGAAKGRAALRQSRAEPLPLDRIHGDESVRERTRFGELDRVLGGGIVPGSLVLIGGDPGIGKSTILMQGLCGAAPTGAAPILYASGEESAQQIKMRAARLGLEDRSLLVFAENELEAVLEAVQQNKPRLLVIDSIQTLCSSALTSAPGSVSQVRECTARLMVVAKSLGVATFLVGHITKDGSIAGPKVLEHMVDTVLYFEGSSNHAYRVLRTVKNRFGSTNEIGVFEMVQSGLREVSNPSELFLQERPINSPGTVVVSAIEGTRPLLVEVQALVSSSSLAQPRRTTLGVDHNKVSLLVAVIEKKLGIPMYGHDVFVNVAGGIRLEEPAADLGTALALVSSFRNHPVDSKLLVCGEVGLTGEVRRVAQLDQRLAEAERLGFRSAIVPKSSLVALEKAGRAAVDRKISVLGVTGLGEAVDALE